jgi:hypothetical protein
VGEEDEEISDVEDEKDFANDEEDEPDMGEQRESDSEDISLLKGYEMSLDQRVLLHYKKNGTLVEFEREMRQDGRRKWVNKFGLVDDYPDYDWQEDTFYNVIQFPDASVRGCHGSKGWYNDGVALGLGGFGCCVLWHQESGSGEVIDVHKYFKHIQIRESLLIVCSVSSRKTKQIMETTFMFYTRLELWRGLIIWNLITLYECVAIHD